MIKKKVEKEQILLILHQMKLLKRYEIILSHFFTRDNYSSKKNENKNGDISYNKNEGENK